MKKYYSYNKPYCNFFTGELLNPIKTDNFSIIQVADNLYKDEWRITEHKQYCDLEITFISSGHATVRTNDSSADVGQGEIYLSFGKEMHELKSESTCRFLTLAFNVNSQSALKKVLAELKKRFYSEDKRTFFLPSLQQSILNSFAELKILEKQNDFINGLALDTIITQILISLLRGENFSGSKRYDYEDLEHQMVKYIDENFLKILSIKEISSYIGYSYSFTAKMFKRTFNCTLKNYILKKKMDFSAELLEGGNFSVNEVAEKTGYSSLYNFSRAFKNFHGSCPSNFIKKSVTK